MLQKTLDTYLTIVSISFTCDIITASEAKEVKMPDKGNKNFTLYINFEVIG